MFKRIITLILLTACCLSLGACGPSRARQVKNVKQKIPEVKQFVEENGEFLQILLDVKETIYEFNEQEAKKSDKPIQIEYYMIVTREDQVKFITYANDSNLRNSFSPLTEDERQLVCETMLQIELSNTRAYANIFPDKISFEYARSSSTGLVLVTPVIELEDPGLYYDPFEFTEEVNDEWCIYIYNKT